MPMSSERPTGSFLHSFFMDSLCFYQYSITRCVINLAWPSIKSSRCIQFPSLSYTYSQVFSRMSFFTTLKFNS